MKKISSIAMTVLVFVVFAFAQGSQDTVKVDSLRSIQKVESNSSLNKQTRVRTTPTNWSRIKDLFK
jgi:hypothetical protein